MGTEPHALQGVAERALEMVPDGAVVGLGTGHAATVFVHALAECVRAGLRVHGIPTSNASEDLARQLGIPLTTFFQVEAVDLDVDWAAFSHKLVVLVGEVKLVPVLGSHGTLSVEVVPFGLIRCMRRLPFSGCLPQPRVRDGKLFVSDNGNYLLDCRIYLLPLPSELERALQAIPGWSLQDSFWQRPMPC
jgi:ribose 5-phosphate isomerase A